MKTSAKYFTLSTLALLSLTSVPVFAGTVSTTLNDCASGNVTVTTVTIAATQTVINAAPINFKSCYGAFAGNDTPYPTTNLGYFNDGLLNGQNQKWQGPGTGGDLFGNGAFLTSPYSAYDLNHDGIADPGWIYLGKVDGPGTNGFEAVAKIGAYTGIVLDSFFSISFDATKGIWNWAFTPDLGVIARAGVVLGDAYFDQFALVFKQGDAFAAYNFTGQQFGFDHPTSAGPVLNFYGTADLSPVFGSRGLSHVSLWARDPGSDNSVPEPGTLVLSALALVGLGTRRRKADK